MLTLNYWRSNSESDNVRPYLLEPKFLWMVKNNRNWWQESLGTLRHSWACVFSLCFFSICLFLDRISHNTVWILTHYVGEPGLDFSSSHIRGHWHVPSHPASWTWLVECSVPPWPSSEHRYDSILMERMTVSHRNRRQILSGWWGREPSQWQGVEAESLESGWAAEVSLQGPETLERAQSWNNALPASEP